MDKRIYHITHIKNLPSILADGRLLSDVRCHEKKRLSEIIGMPRNKERRMFECLVNTNSPAKVGEYVPFNFCPRSVMLYIDSKGNHPDIIYDGGQAPIVHLQFNVDNVIEWANLNNIHWTFTDRNASANVAKFYDNVGDFDKLDWKSINSNDWRDSFVKEHKQAEFLVFDSLPINLIAKIGVFDAKYKGMVEQIIKDANDNLKVSVEVKTGWYY